MSLVPSFSSPIPSQPGPNGLCSRTALTPHFANRAAVRSAFFFSGAPSRYDRFVPQNLTGVPSSNTNWLPFIRTPPCFPAGFSSQSSKPITLGPTSLDPWNANHSGPAMVCVYFSCSSLDPTKLTGAGSRNVSVTTLFPAFSRSWASSTRVAPVSDWMRQGGSSVSTTSPTSFSLKVNSVASSGTSVRVWGIGSLWRCPFTLVTTISPVTESGTESAVTSFVNGRSFSAVSVTL